MPPFDSESAIKSLQAKEAFEYLNLLDDLWTFYLSNSQEISNEQVNDLNQLTGQMLEAIGNAGIYAEVLLKIIGAQQDAFNEAFECTLTATTLNYDQRNLINEVVTANGGFSNFAIQQVTKIMAESQEEGNVLRGKMDQLLERGIPEGDLRHPYKCALTVALLAATIGVMISTGTILVPAVTVAVQSGAGAAAVVNAFIASHGVAFIVEATHAAENVVKVAKDCFQV